MSCPICGAKCRCKKAGQDGLCCSCHHHKPKKFGKEQAWGSSLGVYYKLHADERKKRELGLEVNRI